MKSIAKVLVLIVFITCVFLGSAFGQSTGDICMVGANADNPDIILMVTLVPVSGTTDIYFSDNEWNGSAWADLNEGIKKYTTPLGGLEAGDVVELDFTNNTATVGTLANESGSFALGTSGDQFYMYLGTAMSPSTFLFAITLYGVWGAGELTNTGLTSSVDALIFASSTDNVRYDGTRTGTVAELKTAIADETTNWGTSLNPYTFSTTAFTISEVPLPITLSSFTASAINGTVELAWETATETNNARFVIYRNDVAIGSVDGAGTTSEPHNYSFVDDAVVPGVTYTYVLADVDYSNTETKYDDEAVTVTVANDLVEADFVVGAAYPNPFNPSTVISMHYAVGSNTVINIYNTQGVLVDQLINGFVEAGSHDLTWNASNMPSGVYIVKMIAGEFVNSQKIVLMK